MCIRDRDNIDCATLLRPQSCTSYRAICINVNFTIRNANVNSPDKSNAIVYIDTCACILWVYTTHTINSLRM